MMHFFAVEHLSAGYARKEVLRDISFQTQQGSLVGVLGANGSGKTTLLKAICQLVAHSGSCLLEGEEIGTFSARNLARKCAYIPQRSGIEIDISLLDVVCMGFNSSLGILQQPTKEMKARAMQALQQVGLAERADENYRLLSEGQKQLCIVARTLVTDAKLFLLDEPESALDIQHRSRLMALFRDTVKERNACVLAALHDPNLALHWCDKLLLIQDGTILEQLYPKKDSLKKMEQAFAKLYGDVSLLSCKDAYGNEHLVLFHITEEGICSR